MTQKIINPAQLERRGDNLSAFDGLVFRPRSDAPIWQQIYDHVLGLIEDGFLQPGSQLPGETHLAEELAVTRITLRQALQQLQQEGHLLLARAWGSSCATCPPPSRFGTGGVFSIVSKPRRSGRYPDTADYPRAGRTGRGCAAPSRTGDHHYPAMPDKDSGKQPVYVNTKVFPAELFPDFEQIYGVRQSVTDVFRAHGIKNYRRIETGSAAALPPPMKRKSLT